ncbi:MAG: YraN family protein [Candidatus Promineifilaceae bacterium]
MTGNGRKKLGAFGERVAAIQLESAGYRIVARNWRCQTGEIDLIAQKEGVLHFVEVKTRKGRQSGSPEEALTPRKSQQLTQLALRYIAEYELDDADWQIDLVAVELDAAGKVLRIDHIPNVVLGW